MTTLRELIIQITTAVDTAGVTQANAAIDRTKVNAEKFSGSLDAITGKLKKVGSAIAAAFAFSKIKGELQETIATANDLTNASIRIGVSVKTLQELEFAAGQSSTSVDELRNGFKFLAKNVNVARLSAGAQRDSFDRLGISLDDLKSKTVDETFLAVADSISKIQDPIAKTGAALEVFGRSGDRLVEFLSLGAKGITDLRQAARDLGGGFSEEAGRGAKALTDRMAQLRFSIVGLKSRALEIMLPALESITKGITSLVVGVQKAIVALRPFKTAIQLAIAGSFFLKIRAMIVAFGGVSAIVASVRSGFVRMLPVLARFGKALLRLAIPFLILDDLIVTLKGGDSALRRLVDSIFGVGATTSVVEGLRDAFLGVFRGVKLMFNMIFASSPEARAALEAEFFRATEALTKMMDRLFNYLYNFFTKDIPEFASIAGAAIVERIKAAIESAKGAVSDFAARLNPFNRGRSSTPLSPKPVVAQSQSRSVSVNDTSSVTINVRDQAIVPAIERTVSKQKQQNRAAILVGVGG